MKLNQCIENDPGFLNEILISDEAHCHRSGHIKKQNMRFWTTQQRHQHLGLEASTEKSLCGVYLAKKESVVHIFFKDDNGHAVMVNRNHDEQIFMDPLFARLEPAKLFSLVLFEGTNLC